jgi:hypothetical protein
VAALIDTAGHHTFTQTIMGNRSGDPKTDGSDQSLIIWRKMTSRISSSSRMKLPCGRARMASNPAEFVPSRHAHPGVAHPGTPTRILVRRAWLTTSELGSPRGAGIDGQHHTPRASVNCAPGGASNRQRNAVRTTIRRRGLEGWTFPARRPGSRKPRRRLRVRLRRKAMSTVTAASAGSSRKRRGR